jgi:glycosyltransferase involved in cell wall biosynthesis
MAILDVLVPCYRYGRFLPGCITSILSQSLSDVRVLIIDDASPDDSAAVAQQLAKQDRRIEIIAHQTNYGHIATYNEGIEWASSPYFLLLSADDLLAPGALKRAVCLMEARADVVLTYGACIKLEPGQPVPFLTDGPGEVHWRVRSGCDFVRKNCASIRNSSFLSKRETLPVLCSNRLRDDTIHIVHSAQLRKLRGCLSTFIVCIRADFPKRIWAHYHLVQNNSQIASNTSLIPLWIQSSSIKLHSERVGVH